MYYNKDIFDAHDTPYPTIGWSRDDSYSAALAIRDPSGGTYSYIYGWPSADAALFLLAHGGQLWDARQEPVRLTFDDPRNVEALNWFTQLVSDDGVTLTPKETERAFPGPSIGEYNAVWTGKVGLWTGGFWERGGGPYPAGRKWPMRWGMTTVPYDVHSVTQLGVHFLAISSKAGHPEACWQWLSFLSGQIPPDWLPARRSLIESDLFQETVGSDAAAVARARRPGSGYGSHTTSSTSPA